MSERRQHLSAAAKASVIEAQQRACAECGDAFTGTPEFDHVLPLGLGGTNALSNWQALCRPCHREKTFAKGGDLSRMSKADRQGQRAGQQKLRAERKATGRQFFQSRPLGWRHALKEKSGG